jgi:hypothetical protein
MRIIRRRDDRGRGTGSAQHGSLAQSKIISV